MEDNGFNKIPEPSRSRGGNLHRVSGLMARVCGLKLAACPQTTLSIPPRLSERNIDEQSMLDHSWVFSLQASRRRSTAEIQLPLCQWQPRITRALVSWSAPSIDWT